MESFLIVVSSVVCFVVLCFFVLLIYLRYGTPREATVKRDYDSLDAFIVAYSGYLRNNSRGLAYINQLRESEICTKCEADKRALDGVGLVVTSGCLNESIVVTYYSSDKESWRHLAGSEGYLFTCRKHNIVVYDMVICLS